MTEVAKVDRMPVEQSPATPATLLQMAVQGGASMEQLSALMDLQDRHEANEARKAYVVAMTAFKAEPIKIEKRRKVEFNSTSYMHADLADVTSKAIAAMAKHGLSHRWEVKQEDKQIQVSCIVTHERGHSESVTIAAGPDQSGGKNAIQAVASAITYLERYTFMAITGLAAHGMDDDAGNAEPKPDWREPWIEKFNAATTEAGLLEVRKTIHATLPQKHADMLKPYYVARMKELKAADESGKEGSA